MSRHSPATRTARRCLIAVALLAPFLASHAEAQTRAPARREPHRLTEDMIVKISTIMNEWNPQGPPFLQAGHDAEKWQQGTKLIHDLVLEARQGKTALIERTPALKTAIQRAGLTPTVFSAATDAYFIAQDRLRAEEMLETEEEKKKYGYPPAMGIELENQELMRRVSKQRDLWSII
jgi:hypothetical protein